MNKILNRINLNTNVENIEFECVIAVLQLLKNEMNVSNNNSNSYLIEYEKYISNRSNVLKKYASNDNNHLHQETAHVHTFKGHGYPVQTIDITKDNSTIISAGGDRDIFIFDVGKGHLKHRLKFHKAAISSINFNILYAFSPKDRFMGLFLT